VISSDYRLHVGEGSPQLPGSLRPGSTFPFVGRSAELEMLRTLMPSAEGEGRRVVLLAGEPGSGKSRLVREFAGEAAANGAVVLYGSCDAIVRTPYGPFVEALDHLVRVTEPTELRRSLGGAGGELTRLLPDLATRVGELAAPVKADPDTERHRLHKAVTDLLAGVGRRTPLLLVLEDGHWADGPTLLLLRHLARAAADARLLLIATFRDTEADVPKALSETLADLRRSDDVVRLRLAGLSDDEVAEFVRRASGSESELGPELLVLSQAMRDLSDGNAFLVCELWRALVETGIVEVSGTSAHVARPLSELGTPESVREVVSQRLARLAEGTTDLLELAAVAGTEFELELVRRAAGLSEPELLAAVDEAVASGMLEELPSRRFSCRFTHELVRRALYDRLSRARRAELHLRVGEALESRDTPSGRELADLAHHFAAASPLGGTERAVGYNLAAARAAVDAFAFDEAVLRLRTAIDLGIDRAPERAEVFLELGTASHRAGKAQDALDAFAAAAETARALKSPELLARAAIGYEDACWRPGIVSHESVELLEEAIAALGHEEPTLRAGLLSGLARALDFMGARERGALVRSNAVELARRLDDRAQLAKVLVRSYWSRGTSSLEEILAMLTEAKEIAEELRDTEIRAEAMSWRVPTFVALCDLESARRQVEALRETAEKTAQPFMIHVADHYASALALCDGRLAEAEALAQRSHEWGRMLTGRDPSGTYGLQMFSVLREQGRLAELAPAVRILAARAGRTGPWRPGLIVLLAELGMESEARRALAELAAEGLDAFRPTLWLASLTYLTDASAALGDEAMAALVYPELESLSGANVMIGHLVCCYGAADRYLGMLAATLGEAERAEEHFERALELNARMGASTWLAHTAYQYARFLLGQGRGARERAQAQAAEAAALAERLGMHGLRAKLDALGVPAAAAGLPGGLSPREAQILGLVARGLSNREIGGALSISEHTAANHIRSILSKTNCANRTEAASYAHRHGLVAG
jgi:DNA-binding CsgD family transcriptional regulator/tetratricopeptide (TPR) repeat protein